MRFKHPLIAALVALMLIGGALFLVVRDATTGGRLYKVSEVRAGLARDPKAWLGRTVSVRGTPLFIFVGFGPPMYTLMLPPRHGQAGIPAFNLADSAGDVPQDSAAMLVEYGQEDALLAFLRHLPLLAAAVPQPQRLHGNAVYRLRIEVYTGVCHRPLCVMPVLLDAALPAS